jgi:four helix bundle protein
VGGAFYQLILARDPGYLSPKAHEDLDTHFNEVKRMLNGFIQKLR